MIDACPKHMEFGPCGGVRADGACETGEARCPFVGTALRRWPATVHAERAPLAGTVRDRPRVVCDVRPRGSTLEAVRELAQLYHWADLVLVGDHHETVDLPASIVAAELQHHGIRTVATLTCRDRNRVALEAELAALRAFEVETVHCVTGDIRAPHVRPGARAVFDLDAHRLVALAATMGVSTSVAESPGAPPRQRRVDRAIDKHRAGAGTCFVNVSSSQQVVAEFARAVHRAAPGFQLVVCIPVFTDAEGALRLASLPGVELPADEVEEVLGATDPVRAGIERATAGARAALEMPGVIGVNLSGPASTVGPVERASVMREIQDRLR